MHDQLSQVRAQAKAQWASQAFYRATATTVEGPGTLQRRSALGVFLILGLAAVYFVQAASLGWWLWGGCAAAALVAACRTQRPSHGLLPL